MNLYSYTYTRFVKLVILKYSSKLLTHVKIHRFYSLPCFGSEIVGCSDSSLSLFSPYLRPPTLGAVVLTTPYTLKLSSIDSGFVRYTITQTPTKFSILVISLVNVLLNHLG